MQHRFGSAMQSQATWHTSAPAWLTAWPLPCMLAMTEAGWHPAARAATNLLAEPQLASETSKLHVSLLPAAGREPDPLVPGSLKLRKSIGVRDCPATRDATVCANAKQCVRELPADIRLLSGTHYVLSLGCCQRAPACMLPTHIAARAWPAAPLSVSDCCRSPCAWLPWQGGCVWPVLEVLLSPATENFRGVPCAR